jgi:hypothetical protein
MATNRKHCTHVFSGMCRTFEEAPTCEATCNEQKHRSKLQCLKDTQHTWPKFSGHDTLHGMHGMEFLTDRNNHLLFPIPMFLLIMTCTYVIIYTYAKCFFNKPVH